MNDGLNREIDDVLLDRLVDGELDAREYRELLAALDTWPDGWRRCALAFLEDQALRRDLGRERHELSSPPIQNLPVQKDPVQNASVRRRWSWAHGGLITLATAASLLLAFFLVPPMFQSPPSNEGTVRNLAGTRESFKPRIELRTAERRGTEIGQGAQHADDLPAGEYQLAVSGHDGQPRQIEMPIFAADDPRAHLLLNEYATMPVELMRGLQNMGYQVERERQWAPMGEPGENAVLVPIEELHITPVSGRSYQ